MKSKFNQLTGLYEQANTEPINQDINADVPVVQSEDTQNTGKLHAFAITEDNVDSINMLLNSTGTKEGVNPWISQVPTTVIGNDGTIGGASMLDGKPVYLMIRISTKKERASSEVQITPAGINDRVYVLLDTSKDELNRWLASADNKDDRIRVGVKTHTGKEHSLEIWKESNVNLTTDSDTTEVTVDMDAQMKNPGTSAGISGTIEEGVYQDIKNLGKKVTGRTSAAIARSANARSANARPANAGAALGAAANAALGAAAKVAPRSATDRAGTALAVNQSAFKTQEDGDAYRVWANSTAELREKYGKTSKFDLDVKGKFDNSFINNSYAASKAEYDKFKSTGDSNFKVGSNVYWKVISEPAKTKDVVKTKTSTSGGNEDMYKAKGANPRIYENIAASFDVWKSITEEEDDYIIAKSDVDKVSDEESILIKDINDKNIKGGTVVKVIDDKVITVINTKSKDKKEENINVSSIIDNEKVQSALVKIKADKEKADKEKADKEKAREDKEKADAEKAKKTSGEEAEDNLAKEKEDTKDLRSELKSKRKEKRDTKKSGRHDNKQEKLKGKISKLDNKMNASESVVYDFDTFIKIVNKLN